MFVETLEVLSTATSTIELSEKLIPTFKKIFSLIKNGELRIAIFGAGGTGKTTLGKLLSGKFELSSFLPTYQESITIEQYKLDSNVVGSVIIVPGQERRQDSWDDLLRAISGGKIKLIIHVVSWGYHSFGEISYKQHKLYQRGMTSDQFVQEYTRYCQNRELEVLRKIEPHISIADQKKTVLITLVSKQDIWWDNREQVKQYYINGDYGKLVQEIFRKKGSVNFTHEYQSASLVLENFISGTGELLSPTTEGYDQRLKFANFKNFLGTIEAILKISLDVKDG
jgi:GTPase SAR1 family protein